MNQNEKTTIETEATKAPEPKMQRYTFVGVDGCLYSVMAPSAYDAVRIIKNGG